MNISQIYNEHKNSVYRLALTYMHSTGEAEDICHDVFMRLIQNRASVCKDKEHAWLMTVTANLCRDRLRFLKRHSNEKLPEDIPYTSGSTLEITDAVMSLSVKERTVIYLYYYEGYSTHSPTAAEFCSGQMMQQASGLRLLQQIRTST